MRLHVDRPVAMVIAAVGFYFILDQEYHVVWVPILVGIWIYGMRADLASTFRQAGMLKYESNKLLAVCMHRYGSKRAISITVACETGFVFMISVLLSRPIGFDVAGFAFVAGVVGVYHLYCARSNDNFKP